MDVRSDQSVCIVLSHNNILEYDIINQYLLSYVITSDVNNFT